MDMDMGSSFVELLSGNVLVCAHQIDTNTYSRNLTDSICCQFCRCLCPLYFCNCYYSYTDMVLLKMRRKIHTHTYTLTDDDDDTQAIWPANEMNASNEWFIFTERTPTHI